MKAILAAGIVVAKSIPEAKETRRTGPGERGSRHRREQFEGGVTAF